MFKRILVFIICAVLMLSGMCVVSAAAEKREWSPCLSVENITATANDTVLVNIELTNNTYGIMAFTLSLMYDKSALTYVGYSKGLFRDNWMYVVEKDGYIAMVNCEKTNIFGDGTMITLEFTVNEDVHGGTYPLKIAHVRPKTNGENLKDCLANKRGDIITPTVNNGSLIVPVTQENCRHKFGKWQEKVVATCIEDGMDSRNCETCGKNEIKTTKKTGVHTYQEEWTVDVSATKDNEGVMSRHCKYCSEKTDYIYFPYKSAEESLKQPEKEPTEEIGKDVGFNNQVGDMVEETEKIVVDNYKPGASKPPSSTQSSSKEETSTNSEATNTKPSDESGSKSEYESLVEEENVNTDANVLITDKENTKGKKQGIAGKVYSFLYGEDGKGGIINAILKAIKQFINQLFK